MSFCLIFCGIHLEHFEQHLSQGLVEMPHITELHLPFDISV